VLSCTAEGHTVQISLFDQAAKLSSDYDSAISKSGVPSSSGDCTISPDAEHRYPSEDTATGRVLCYQHDGTTTFIWSNYRQLTLSQIDQPDLNTASLGSSWARWVDLPAFPTHGERVLINLVNAKGCQRPPAGSLESFTSLSAAITCASPGTGAGTISYFRFSRGDALTQAQSAQQTAVRAQSGVDCSGTTPGFLGEQGLDLRGTDVGSELCYLSSGKKPILQWSLTPLQLMIRATGTTPTALMSWWRDDYGFAPPTTALVNAVNAQALPSFPTDQESSLLSRVPSPSRIGCMRLSPHQIAVNVGDIPVTAITCGPTRGAILVFYYQFRNHASMAAAASKNGINRTAATGPDCTTRPPKFIGAAPYMDATKTGVLGCGTNSNGPYLIWSDDRLNIIVMAFGGGDPVTMLEWWRHQAGPQ
jgi:hypothetical protein